MDPNFWQDKLNSKKVIKEKKLFEQIGRVRSVELDKDKNIFVGVENLGIIKLIEWDNKTVK